MKLVFNVVIFAVISTVVIEKVDSLKCYQCNSHYNSTCADEKVPEHFATDCPKDGNTYILCRKIKQVIDFEVNGLPPDSRIIRSCGRDDRVHPNKCYQRSGFGGRQEVCSCQEENCNGSPMIDPSITLTAIITATALIKSIFF